MEAITSLNTKISVTDKELFVKTTEALGLTPSGAIKIFVRMFNQCGGFPFEVRKLQQSEHPQAGNPQRKRCVARLVA